MTKKELIAVETAKKLAEQTPQKQTEIFFRLFEFEGDKCIGFDSSEVEYYNWLAARPPRRENEAGAAEGSEG